MNVDRLSVLGQLGQRRKEILADSHKDLRVRRWTNPEIWVRYRPIPPNTVRSMSEKIEKMPKAQRADGELNLTMDALIKACIGVYGKLDGDDTCYSLRPGEPNSELTRFDPDLAANLGIPDPETATARQVLKALFCADDPDSGADFGADIFSHGGALTEWSGYQEAEAAEDLAGES